MHDSQIVGYTFKAENICIDPCAREIAVAGTLEAGSATMWSDVGTTEEILGEWALLAGVDRSDQWSYDSRDFPKPIRANQIDVEHERCGRCSQKLIYDE